jgi:cytochrome c-type biogenesis protein CcmF
MDIRIKQTNPLDNYIIVKALVFPFINVLWLGVLVMVFGFFISLGDLVTRIRKVFPGLKEE